MYCYRCGKPNPEENRFCGMCGARLPEVPAGGARPAEAPPPPPPRPVPPLAYDDADVPSSEPPPASVREEPLSPHSGIGGPSFLGLGGSSALMDEIEAEEEAEARSRRRRRAAALAVVLVLAVLLGLQWTRSGPGQEQLNEVRTFIGQQLQGSPPAQSPAAGTADEEEEPAEQDAGETAGGDSAEQPAAAAGRTGERTESSDEGMGDFVPPGPESTGDEGMGDFVPPPPEAEEEEKEQPAPPQAARRDSTPQADRRSESDQLVRRADVFLAAADDARTCEQGVGLLRQAAQQGNARAHVKLGALHATGTCVQADRVAAYRWFTLAEHADPRNTYIAHSKRMLLRDMDEWERRRADEIDRMKLKSSN